MDASFTQRFGLSANGFLPSRLPLAHLPDPYYAPWEAIITRLPELLQNKDLRSKVRSLSVLSTNGLATEPEWRRAYVILVFLTHAYIWGDDPVAEVLPPCIAVPLLAVSSYLELPPVATYAALNLWNFTTEGAARDGDKTAAENPPENPPAAIAFDDLDRLKALHTFTGTASESWFYVVSVAMECRAAAILPVLVRAIEAVAIHHDVNNNQSNTTTTTTTTTTVTAALDQFVACIHEIGLLLDRMHERCDPSVFFYRIRPFLAGSKHMAAQGLPRGVFYDEESGGGEGKEGDASRGQWRQLRGGSNGQSSLLQFFDLALGVEHTSDGRHSAALRAFVQQQAEDEEDDDDDVLSDDRIKLLTAFAKATEALAAFRNKHLAIVTRYIIIPSRQKQAAEAAEAAEAAGTKEAKDLPSPSKLRGLARVSTHRDAADMLTGTGGTELLPFLKQTRDETLQAGVFAATTSA
ncbi:MAG: hypothetical protein STHCBS139747_004978 [Sporothrix thermara]